MNKQNHTDTHIDAYINISFIRLLSLTIIPISIVVDIHIRTLGMVIVSYFIWLYYVFLVEHFDLYRL